ncbi:uncharacterized protein LOC115448815 [Manduca sexta]|uniref:E3 ubiquitin-protein ligase APD1-4 middle domain-containing protein n=1 Tax=Manduca sexta TaxID=7130 RepID=A0A922CUH6_MANSE|nr:uncharacterized protein LOC115448815 [Manduca sexta]XP_030032240.1 uncharacterized protein LOC115448815 [Manduca sexta]XP_030032241.1 uncharacterized protein LOC115448815 [Manduca sexta]XP_030032242.1 uncharacterized protein LOC115448815 [Manduca sexta]XP_037299414.1 uncharacterized protein LOC115448815 [Manduca sexta]XP_037299423.1 uncharacterized protein LOC115448815 [Manduca sexta]XP_037299424.1 uncharacterized protein LOC115448815 [Manduca sexta]XP_037299430.1 uncharacterized protein 
MDPQELVPLEAGLVQPLPRPHVRPLRHARNCHLAPRSCYRTPLRLCRLLVLLVTIPSMFIVVPLYLRFRVFSAQMYPMSMTDMRLIDSKISPTWCQRQVVKSNATFNAFVVPGTPQLTDELVPVSMTRELELEDDMKEYWGFYLLKGSSVTVSACVSYPGASLIMIKGYKHLQECAYIGDDSSEELSELMEAYYNGDMTNATLFEKIKDLRKEDGKANDPGTMRRHKAGVSFHDPNKVANATSSSAEFIPNIDVTDHDPKELREILERLHALREAVKNEQAKYYQLPSHLMALPALHRHRDANVDRDERRWLSFEDIDGDDSDSTEIKGNNVTKENRKNTEHTSVNAQTNTSENKDHANKTTTKNTATVETKTATKTVGVKEIKTLGKQNSILVKTEEKDKPLAVQTEVKHKPIAIKAEVKDEPIAIKTEEQDRPIGVKTEVKQKLDEIKKETKVLEKVQTTEKSVETVPDLKEVENKYGAPAFDQETSSKEVFEDVLKRLQALGDKGKRVLKRLHESMGVTYEDQASELSNVMSAVRGSDEELDRLRDVLVEAIDEERTRPERQQKRRQAREDARAKRDLMLGRIELTKQLNEDDEARDYAAEEGLEPDGYAEHHEQLNETTDFDMSNSEFWSSFSSSEEALLECEGLILNLPLTPHKSCNKHATDDETFAAARVNALTYRVPANGYYFFVFNSENEVQRNYIRARFELQKTRYDVARSALRECTNSTARCDLALDIFSTQKVVLEVPWRDNASLWNEQFVIVSECEPRAALYMLCALAVPLTVLALAFQ